MEMDTSAILTLIASLCTAGGLIYLVVEKLFARRQDKADADKQVISNGNEVADLYLKIDQIVESKTKPIQDKLDVALGRIDDLEENWCCWRKNCKDRIHSKKDAQILEIEEELKKPCK